MEEEVTCCREGRKGRDEDQQEVGEGEPERNAIRSGEVVSKRGRPLEVLTNHLVDWPVRLLVS